MGVIVVVVLLFVGLYGGFSFSPGRPTDSGPVPTADAVKAFADAPRRLPFSPAVPTKIPGDWHANSAAISNPDTAAAGAPLTVRGGWLVSGHFIALVASDSSPAELLRAEFGAAAPDTGRLTAGGADWAITTGVRGETAWYRVAPDRITYLITGSADESAFRTLATSIAGS